MRREKKKGKERKQNMTLGYLLSEVGASQSRPAQKKGETVTQQTRVTRC